MSQLYIYFSEYWLSGDSEFGKGY